MLALQFKKKQQHLTFCLLIQHYMTIQTNNLLSSNLYLASINLKKTLLA